MKSTIIKFTLAALLVAGSQLCFAQCDKTVVLKSSKTNFVNDKGEIERTQDQKAVITITKTQIDISVDGDSKMSGTVKVEKCDWPTAFKTGKTVLKATVYDNNDNEQKATITITGADNKVTLLYEAGEQGERKILVTADSFEEKKA
ncbi:MAG: hypothetical protein V4619_15160 [Bacteroidota bacterium]